MIHLRSNFFSFESIHNVVCLSLMIYLERCTWGEQLPYLLASSD
jgi:hypothetical protein